MATEHMAVRGFKFVCACAVGSALSASAFAQTAATRPAGGQGQPHSGTVIITPPANTGGATTPAPTGNQNTGGNRGPMVNSGLNEQGSIRLLLNKSTVLSTSRPYRRISVGQADIAEVNGIGPNRILVTAKKAGTTQIILWDDQDNSQMIDVTVQADMLALRELYPMLFPDARIDIVVNGDTVALTGRVPNLQTADQAVMIAQCYSKNVINLLEVAGGQQVALQVRFAEVSRSVSSALGVNLGMVASGRLLRKQRRSDQPLQHRSEQHHRRCRAPWRSGSISYRYPIRCAGRRRHYASRLHYGAASQQPRPNPC
jgi:Flp pilus assembly secretin CpaC